MIPYAKQHIDSRDIRAVASVLGSDYLTQGPRVVAFEEALASYCGARYAVALSSGTAALHLAYLAAGLTSGDEAITTPNTFAATANIVLACGGKPIFCDIRLDTYNIDERKINGCITRKTKAIVPVHFAGQPCEMDAIKKITRKRKLFVIEDASHALGARYKKSRIGDCRYSDMAVFSFHAIKSITTGEGGAVLTNSKKLYDKLVLLRSHGIQKDKNGFNVMTELGYNYRLTDFQAALGASQLKKLHTFMRLRRKIVRAYQQELKNIDGILLPSELPHNRSAWHLYVIRVKNKKDRMPFYNYLKKHGIGVNFHYPAVYSHPYYQKHGFRGITLPNTKTYQDSCITLPCHVDLIKAHIKRIAKTIRMFFESKKV